MSRPAYTFDSSSNSPARLASRPSGRDAASAAGWTAERSGGGGGDAVLQLDVAGRVTYANAAAARMLGVESALDVVGDELVPRLRRSGHGSAALALHSAVESVHARAPHETSFVVHESGGVPVTEWRVARHGAGVGIVVGEAARETDAPPVTSRAAEPLDGRPARRDDAPAAADASRPLPTSVEPGGDTTPAHPMIDPASPHADPLRDTDALVEIARELARAADQAEQALEQLASGACSLLGGDGACVVMLDDTDRDDARIVAGHGTLASLRGQQTELHEPPSPIHEAIVGRRVVVRALPGAALTADERGAERRHVLVAPLVGGDVVMAALCVVTGPRGFSARDRVLAERLAEHGALAIRNHRLYERVERSARDARLLAEMGQVLAQHVTPEALYPALGRVTREALGACGFAAALADPATGAVERLYSEGTGTLVFFSSDDTRFWESAGGRAVRELRAEFVDGTMPNDASETDRAAAQQLRVTPVRSIALVPLAADETRGLLTIHFPTRRAFDEPERRLLTDLAAHIAVALRNAMLFVTRGRERDRAAAAAEIARVVLDAPALEVGAAAILGVLDRLVPSAGKALSVLRDGPATVECAAASGAVGFMRGMRASRPVRAKPAPPEGRVRPAIVDDLRAVLTKERCPEAHDHPAIAASAVIVPLVARGRTIGDLAVTTPLGRALDAPSRETLVQLAAPIALALDALLLGEERRRLVLEERQMTEQLRQAEKMAALGELVAGVAHEINNPLTGISAFAELLLDESLTDDQRDSVRLIRREADRAVGVVRDLLAFSRKTEPSYDSLDLNALVERTLRLRSYVHRAEGIEVTLLLEPTLPVVHGDEVKLQQVLLNVLLNAEHAMRDATVRRLTVATRRSNGRLVVSITDTGTGIAPDVLPRIFEPFFTTKPAGEGTGLGLSVSYGIVQAHGGELRAESALGTGTTVEISLPARGADTNGSSPPPR